MLTLQSELFGPQLPELLLQSSGQHLLEVLRDCLNTCLVTCLLKLFLSPRLLVGTVLFVSVPDGAWIICWTDLLIFQLEFKY